jgi:hypothetical protein
MSVELDPVMLLRGEMISCPTIGCWKDWKAPCDYTATMIDIKDGNHLCSRCMTWYPWSAYWGEDSPW